MSRKKWTLFGGVALCLTCGLLLPCTVKVLDGEDYIRSQVSLKRIGLALHSYHDVNGRLPPAVVYGKDGRPLYSWRVLLLPYLEEELLYRQFKQDEPWDSKHNQALVKETPRCYVPVWGG